MALEDNAPVLEVPLTAIVPLQAPEAVQEVALLADQLNVELAPLEMLVGLALNDTVGATVATGVTVTDCAALPPVPVQVRVYCVVAVTAAVALAPLIGSVPLHPPDAVQLVAFVEVQVSIAALPFAKVVGLAERVIAGTGLFTVTVTDCDAVPPAPVQLMP